MVNWDSSLIKRAFLTLFYLSLLAGQPDIFESFDPEHGLPESDLVILDHAQIFYDTLSTESASLLSQLSFLSESDATALAAFNSDQTSSFNASAQLNQLIKLLWLEKDDKQKRGLVRYKMNLGEDVQYRWKFEHYFENSQVGIIGERDSYEPSAIDYASLFYKTNIFETDVTLGHFQFMTGHGLVSWRTMPLKSDFGISNAVMRLGKGIQPYRSGHESWAYRGVGLQRQFGDIHVSSCMSSRQLDGALNENNVSISATGLHATQSQIERKNNLSEFIFLNEVEYPMESGILGAVFGTGRWSEKSNSFSNTIISMFGRYEKEMVAVSGETSINSFGKKGMILSSVLKHDSFQYGTSYRLIDPEYFGIRDNMYRNWNGLDHGEWGILNELRIRITPAVVTIYSDEFGRVQNEVGQFLTRGSETGMKLQYKHTPSVQSYLQIKLQENSGSSYSYEFDNVELESSVNTKIGIKWIRSSLQTFQTQLQYRVHPQNGDASYGIQFRNKIQVSNWKLNLFWMSSIIKNNQWLYFWDVTLPGEMRSKVFTTSGQYIGTSVLYRTSEFSEVQFRVSYHWKSLSFKTTPIVRSALQINLMI